MLQQRLQQKLLQKLSPQQIQLMKLLQLPTVALEQRVKQETENNPTLEEGAEESDEQENQVEELDFDEEKDDDIQGENEEDAYDDQEFDISDYIDDDEIPTYRLKTDSDPGEEEKKEVPYTSEMSLQDYLLSQLGLKKISDREYLIASHIIGNIDDVGYLQRDIRALVDDLAFTYNLETDFNELLNILRQIQEFDPPGIGARDLQECLLLQINRKTPFTPALENAKKLIEKNFKDFTKKHYEKIKNKLGFTDKELKDAIAEVLKLNPKPGNTINEAGKNEQYIIPDFIVNINNGELELTLNSRNAPELKVNRTYVDMLEKMAQSKDKSKVRQKEAMMFVKQKLDSARMFIDAIKQRQNTLLVTMQAILEYQKDYFLTGDETLLRPMILKDIADMVGLDISTISRVANSKYVQTPFGTFLLKSFFSESLQKDNGEEVSTREVKKILQNCIEKESKTKPLTDEELAEILREKGYNIARRTVAKYREQLNIPVARLRKELV